MNVEFLFDVTEKWLKENGIIYNKHLLDSAWYGTLKGIYWHGNDTIYINLGCLSFKILDEDSVIREISKTITHEYIHKLIGTKIPPLFYSLDGEDRVCMLLAGQEQPFCLKELEIFI